MLALFLDSRPRPVYKKRSFKSLNSLIAPSSMYSKICLRKETDIQMFYNFLGNYTLKSYLVMSKKLVRNTNWLKKLSKKQIVQMKMGRKKCRRKKYWSKQKSVEKSAENHLKYLLDKTTY